MKTFPAAGPRDKGLSSTSRSQSQEHLDRNLPVGVGVHLLTEILDS